tara:strand:- start:9881 stop:10279 length:399 start_codon:yes stop_codon:yes gene_type:complete
MPLRLENYFGSMELTEHLHFLQNELQIPPDAVYEHLSGTTSLILVIVGIIYGIAAEASPSKIVELFMTPSVMISFLESFLEEELTPQLDSTSELLINFFLKELVAYNALANKIRELAKTNPLVFSSVVPLLC